MNCHIILVGTELLNGLTLETNSLFIAEELNRYGIIITGKSVVGDNVEDIEKIISNVESDNDLIIISGGIGPTIDDITREAVAKFYNISLITNEIELEKLKEKFRERKIAISENNKKQADMPGGAEIIQNKLGSAPAFFVGKIAVFPGVPAELKYTFKNFIIKYSKDRQLNDEIIVRDFIFWGIPESKLEEKVLDILQASTLEFEFLAKDYGIVIRVIFNKKNEDDIEELKNKILSKTKEYFYGENEDRLETVLADMLKNDLTLSIAESCTGGLISEKVSSVSGASKYFEGGIVCYSNHSKEKYLGVSAKTLEETGAVSQNTVNEMLKGLTSDIGIAISGIAGPTGGTEAKPVGTVFVGVKVKRSFYIKKYFFTGDRSKIRERAAYSAIKMLIDKLKMNSMILDRE